MDNPTTPESQARPRSRWQSDKERCKACGTAIFYRPEVDAYICRLCNPLPNKPVDQKDPEACPFCSGKRFWRSKYKVTCESCHPPAYEWMVVQRLCGYEPPESEPCSPEARELVLETIDSSGRRGVDRASLDLLVGDHDETGRALAKCGLVRKLYCRFMKGEETWYIRK